MSTSRAKPASKLKGQSSNAIHSVSLRPFPVEPSLDLQQASVSDDQNRVNLRRRSADPVSDVSVEILLQLLDALGRCQSDEMTISTDVM
ncbi:hypothetical protein QFZ83_006472 [Variovorax sp. W1I1]|uniref:hypothetical protein n=1 Tax=Variovorax sp. W1I1 TaxID=3042309 RepID=UPI002782D3F8|nr:hypothetical protein [Variovorax sp. W1I1]MDQ0612301.1 hypothetical protein [Variovorax sp. W1I1]